MNIQSDPYRVTFQSLTKPLNPSTALPRPWLDLSTETRRQIAQSLAQMLLRMRPTRAPTKADRHVESVE